jgi:ABC-2 type transport system permease protein
MNTINRLLWRQTKWELRLNLKNGEQILLVVVIPVAIFLAATTTSFLPSLADSPATALATVLSVSVLASAFTSVAISTAFERRSGALLYMSTTPLGKPDVVLAKVIATLFTVLISCGAVFLAALSTSFSAVTGLTFMLPAVFVVIIFGAIASASWALTLASTLRAEGVLALANALFVLAILFGGVLIPLDQLPDAWANVAQFLLPGALTTALTSIVETKSIDIFSSAVLLAWAMAGTVAASRFFKWV